MSDLQLDCRGLSCPMPIVELTKAARQLGSGKSIEVTAADLAFKLDVEAWARRTGNSIQKFEEVGEEQHVLILLN